MCLVSEIRGSYVGALIGPIFPCPYRASIRSMALLLLILTVAQGESTETNRDYYRDH